MAVVFKEIKLPQPMPMPSEAQIALADFNRSFGEDELRVVMHNGRQFLGIDISEEYCKTAERRLADIIL